MTLSDPRLWVLTPTDPRTAENKGVMTYGVCPGSFGRTPPETIGDSRTEFNRILCTSKSEAAVTSNKQEAQVRREARAMFTLWRGR